ncbi:MAG: SMC-Scp complex subunit ScpB [Candidatus Helarchaeota archaeon]
MEEKNIKKLKEIQNNKIEELNINDSEVEELDINDSEVEELNINDSEVEELNINDSEVEELDINDSEVEELDISDLEVEELDINDSEVEELDINDSEVEELDISDSEIEEIVSEAEMIKEINTMENDSNNKLINGDNKDTKPKDIKEENKEKEKEKELENKSKMEKEENKTISIKELTERAELRNRIEAALFVSGRPLGIDEISVKLEIPKKKVEELIKELAFDYQDRTTSIEVVQIGDKFSMQIKPEYTEHVKKFAAGGLIPEAIMRTLTIIALKQPIAKSLLVKLRGSGAYQHIKFLEERGLVSSYKKGRSSVLETTNEFSDMFGLPRDKQKLKEQLKVSLGIKGEVKSGAQEAAEQKARKQKLKKASKEKIQKTLD